MRPGLGPWAGPPAAPRRPHPHNLELAQAAAVITSKHCAAALTPASVGHCACRRASSCRQPQIRRASSRPYQTLCQSMHEATSALCCSSAANSASRRALRMWSKQLSPPWIQQQAFIKEQAAPGTNIKACPQLHLRSAAAPPPHGLPSRPADRVQAAADFFSK